MVGTAYHASEPGATPFVRVGDSVKAGQLLYQIDPAVYQANVASAKANLAKAQANEQSARLKAKRYAELVKVKAISRATSSAKAGSKLSRPGWPIPISGVLIDWCAPPSPASVMPEGVPTRRKRAS